MPFRRFFQRSTVTGVQARQGFLDRPVLVVLAASLGLVTLAFGIMLLQFW
jgi:hypothetical protein